MVVCCPTIPLGLGSILSTGKNTSVSYTLDRLYIYWGRQSKQLYPCLVPSLYLAVCNRYWILGPTNQLSNLSNTQMYKYTNVQTHTLINICRKLKKIPLYSLLTVIYIGILSFYLILLLLLLFSVVYLYTCFYIHCISLYTIFIIS